MNEKTRPSMAEATVDEMLARAKMLTEAASLLHELTFLVQQHNGRATSPRDEKLMKMADEMMESIKKSRAQHAATSTPPRSADA